MNQPVMDTLEQMMSAKRYREAEPVARRVVEDEPQNARAAEILVEILRRTKQWEELKGALGHLNGLAPASLVLHFSTGMLCSELAQFPLAERCFQRVLELDPSHETALIELSRVLAMSSRPEASLELLKELLQKTQRPCEALFRMSVLLRRLGRLEEAYETGRKAVEIEPARGPALVAMADALVDLGRFREAEEILKRATKIDPIGAAGARARLLLVQGDFIEGFKEYNTSLRTQPRFYRTDVPGTAWAGQPLKDKTLLVYEEQGFGDTIQFVRYAEMLAGRGCTVFVEVRAPLKQLISRVKGVSWTLVRDAERPKYDYHVSVIQLPRLMNTKLSNIPAKVPYVTAPARLIDVWKEKLTADPGKLRVGLCWFGNKIHDEDRRRSIPTEMLLPLGELQDVGFYSLQRQAPPEEVEKIAGPLRWIDHSAKLNDFADTAALIMNLDVVVTVDTAIAHLAGALGKPVWTLLHRGGEWRWLYNREDSPWYPTMRIFRQQDANDWPPVIERVKQELAKMAAAR